MTGNDSKEKRSRISNFKINPFYLKFEKKNFFSLTLIICVCQCILSKPVLQHKPLDESVDYIKSSRWGWDLFRTKVKAN